MFKDTVNFLPEFISHILGLQRLLLSPGLYVVGDINFRVLCVLGKHCTCWVPSTAPNLTFCRLKQNKEPGTVACLGLLSALRRLHQADPCKLKAKPEMYVIPEQPELQSESLSQIPPLLAPSCCCDGTPWPMVILVCAFKGVLRKAWQQETGWSLFTCTQEAGKLAKPSRLWTPVIFFLQALKLPK